MTRILMLSQFYPPIIGGEERHVKVLSEALAARGHDVAVATTQPGAEPCYEARGGVSIHRMSGTLRRGRFIFADSQRRHVPPFPDPELVYQLSEIIRVEKPDIIHAHNWLVHSYLPLQVLDRRPLVLSLHDYGSVCAKKNLMHAGEPCGGPELRKCLPCASEHYGSLKGLVTVLANRSCMKLVMPRVDLCLPVSNAVASRCGLKEGGIPFEVVPTFMSDDVQHLQSGYEELIARLPNDDFLLFVGDLTRLKGLHTLLHAYRELAPKNPLVLIGRRCKDTPVDLPPNVYLFESWPHGAVLHAWSRCIVGLAPSEGLETCGTVVMEANAFGRPVVAGRTGGLVDTVVDGRTGILVSPGSSDELRLALGKLLTETELRLKMGAASLAHSAHYMSRAVVPKIEQVYEGLLQNSRAARRA
jgi:glycosyltransferase involved in cell wall biosynthesis